MLTKCIFCQEDSSSSKSVEHIVPESLGNTQYILPKGVVCDKCNNYFSRKIEGKILSYPDFQLDRFLMAIPSKKRKVPAQNAIMQTSVGWSQIVLSYTKDNKMVVDYFGDPTLLSKGKIVIPYFSGGQDDVQEGKISMDIVLSRFIAKIAFESFASRTINKPKVFEELYTDNFDELRKYVRYGSRNNICKYPVFVKTAYIANKVFDEKFEILHEFEFIQEENEIFFSCIIFGIEYKIFLGIIQEYQEVVDSGMSPKIPKNFCSVKT